MLFLLSLRSLFRPSCVCPSVDTISLSLSLSVSLSVSLSLSLCLSLGDLSRAGTPIAPAVQAGVDRRWVTVFGFPSGSAAISTVLRHFQKSGDIVDHVIGKGNWLHLGYVKV